MAKRCSNASQKLSWREKQAGNAAMRDYVTLERPKGENTDPQPACQTSVSVNRCGKLTCNQRSMSPSKVQVGGQFQQSGTNSRRGLDSCQIHRLAIMRHIRGISER